jgi:geranylgeranyl diphosphate synthase type I
MHLIQSEGESMSLEEALTRFLPLIEDDLRQVLRSPHPELAAYYGMMHYHLGWVDEALRPAAAQAGKRLRPALCLLACQAAGGDPRQALPAATAVELVHSFSLIHDDIEDSSPRRRGRPAVWSVWGMPQALNAGDGLFVLARLALHRLADRGVPAARRQAASLAFDQACLALCEGQFFDMAFETNLDVSLDQYLWMIRHKTATLLAASAQLGAFVASDDAALVRRVYAFGENLGMAFQIQDDILGAWGDEQVTGKSTATDIRDRKKTLPVIYALHDAGDEAAARELAALYAGTEPLSAEAARSVLDILDRVGARRYAEDTAAEYYRLALASLAETGLDNEATANLRELAAWLLERQH